MARHYPCHLHIYLLKNLVNEKIYAGSTTDPDYRMKKHKTSYVAGPKTSRLHRQISEIGWGNFYMEVIDHFDCLDKRHAGESENAAIMIWGSLNSALAYVAPEDQEARQKARGKAYIQTDRGKAVRAKAAAKWYKKLPRVECSCGGGWKLESSRKSHQKCNRHKKWVATSGN